MPLPVTIPDDMASELEKLARVLGVSAESLALSLLCRELSAFKKLAKDGDLRKYRPR